MDAPVYLVTVAVLIGPEQFNESSRLRLGDYVAGLGVDLCCLSVVGDSRHCLFSCRAAFASALLFNLKTSAV
jgi:hypothetical protein